MPAMTDILIKDDAAVEKTLVPVTDTPVPFWRGVASGVPTDGQIRLHVSMDTLKDGSTKHTVKLEVPVQETLGASGTSAGYVAPPKVAYVNKAFQSFIFDKRSTEDDRANCEKLMHALMSGASSTTASGVLNGASAANAFKTSTLVIPYAIVKQILPS